ncbi:HNH endonuclease [Candidatus Oscillochloris fontis]|uniref:HNH endonuclease n=1 Tax=Candidatus Oscillochloris fontis TaxID=2496868 RepID=UPI00101BC325|nr:HNH endonuclease [Candidatus Oscillochloris fontis]
MSYTTWEHDIISWISRRRGTTPLLESQYVTFFKQAFIHTKCPDKAWFGSHQQVLSLVVGGIFLAAVVASGTDRGVWLLVDTNTIKFQNWDYSPTKSTLHSPAPLFWLHTRSLDAISELLSHPTIWYYFSLASENIHFSPGISSDRDHIQLQRRKHRLSDFFITTQSTIQEILSETENTLVLEQAFDPHDVPDGRERSLASIVRRRGQPMFRSMLLTAYEGKCAITHCNAEQALEAAHIVPYRGSDTNHPSNGLLLRADLHTLFDLGLIAINPETMTVLIAPELQYTDYNVFADQPIRLPKNTTMIPNREALALHRRQAKL